MQAITWREWASRIGLVSRPAAKRVPLSRRTWGQTFGSEGEQLESRALLSAANCEITAEPTVAAEVAREVAAVPRKAFAVPNVQGTWNVTATSEYFGNGTVTMVQSGKTVTSTVSIQDLPTFTLKTNFKKNAPNVLSQKSPRIEVPGVPIDIRVTIKITFPANDPNPTTFTGAASVPFVGTVGTLTGAKAQGLAASSLESPNPRKAASTPNYAGAYQISVSQVPVIGTLSGQLNLVQKGQKLTGTADLGLGTTLTVKSRIDRKDPTKITGNATVSSPALNVKNAPFKLTVDQQATHFSGTVDIKSTTLQLDVTKLS